MTLVAFGEIRFLDGGATLFARFARPDGATFDMSLSEEQFVELMSGLGDGQEAAAPTPPSKTAAASLLDDEDEDEEVEDSRPFSVASRYADDDL